MSSPTSPATDPQNLLTISLDALLALCPQAAAILARRGMLCVGCPIARFHTLEDAAALYSLDLESLLAEIEDTLRRTRSLT